VLVCYQPRRINLHLLPVSASQHAAAAGSSYQPLRIVLSPPSSQAPHQACASSLTNPAALDPTSYLSRLSAWDSSDVDYQALLSTLVTPLPLVLSPTELLTLHTAFHPLRLPGPPEHLRHLLSYSDLSGQLASLVRPTEFSWP